MQNIKKRLIAIYLPQFHPFKENDEWWGKGFTEWRNVAKAKPRFKGHYQPHIPSDLGFYDLRIPEVREEQAMMAKEYGIYGFCYYHYWFNGHQLMDRPLKEVIKSGNPDFPFMICWANENWTRAWDGSTKKILIKQEYSEEDDKQHINYLIKNVFSDSRYIKINGKPVFCIYNSTLFPNMEQTIKTFRDEANKNGIELYICRVESWDKAGSQHLKAGFDAAIDFQPRYSLVKQTILLKLKNSLEKINYKLFGIHKFPVLQDYGKYVERACKENEVNYKRYPCITPMWDNSSRRVNSSYFALTNSTPQLYQKWLTFILKKFKPFSKEENFIFINAWNEWAEGNHLEPDLKWGRKYLEATHNAINNIDSL